MLLIDEVDRVEVETEALLLEILSEYQVSIPELGTITAKQIPLVFLTSNNTRELSEALKRRCLYLHVDYPDLEREKEIVLTKVPGVSDNLADQIARIVRSHPPARPEEGADACRRRIDWARTLVLLGIEHHRRPAGQGDAPHPAQVPDRHRQGGEGAVGRRLRADRRTRDADARPARRLRPASCATPACRCRSPRTSTRWRRCSTSRSRTARRSSTRSAPRWSRTTPTGGRSRPCSRCTSACAARSTSSTRRRRRRRRRDVARDAGADAPGRGPGRRRRRWTR